MHVFAEIAAVLDEITYILKILDPGVKSLAQFLMILTKGVRNLHFWKNGLCRKVGHLGFGENSKSAVIRSSSKCQRSTFF